LGDEAGRTCFVLPSQSETRAEALAPSLGRPLGSGMDGVPKRVRT
jgi:hypothetical protein